MRDVKFRFVNRYNGDNTIRFEYTSINEIESEDSWQGKVNYERLGINLFTGLLDKNGEEIYEGDIVKNPNAESPEDLGFEVYWNECFAGFEFLRIRRNLDGSTSSWMPNIDSVSSRYEIIGNIYECVI